MWVIKKEKRNEYFPVIERLVQEFLIPGIKAEIGITACSYLQRLEKCEANLKMLATLMGQKLINEENNGK